MSDHKNKDFQGKFYLWLKSLSDLQTMVLKQFYFTKSLLKPKWSRWMDKGGYQIPLNDFLIYFFLKNGFECQVGISEAEIPK